jgi:hypothetical protein
VIFLKDPRRRARYRIPGESTFTRWRGAEGLAAARSSSLAALVAVLPAEFILFTA